MISFRVETIQKKRDEMNRSALLCATRRCQPGSTAIQLALNDPLKVTLFCRLVRGHESRVHLWQGVSTRCILVHFRLHERLALKLGQQTGFSFLSRMSLLVPAGGKHLTPSPRLDFHAPCKTPKNACFLCEWPAAECCPRLLLNGLIA